MTAYILGAYQGDRQLSIDNYFQYCQREIPRCLPEWGISSIRPGKFEEGYFAHTTTPRLDAWRDHFVKWPLTLHGLSSDLYHMVDQGLAWYRFFLRGGKTIVTVHDLINLLVIRGRLALPPIPARRQIIVNMSARQIQRCDAVVCASQNTADAVMTELAVPAKRIYVVHDILPQAFTPISMEERMQTRSLLGDPEYLILHVGKPSAYKNRLGVIKAFELIHQTLQRSRLVVTGQGLTTEELEFLRDKKCAEAISVRIPERQNDLRLLYGASDVLLFPSLYEGFGYPPLEAMACGCPVVSSRAGSLAEIVADAGLTIDDPKNEKAFAEAAIRVLRESTLASQLKAAGFLHAARFSPAHLTPKLAEVYRTTLAQ